MGENSGIEWTDHTFNPWWGCEKVSPACAHCYAETFSRRVGYTDEPHIPGSPDGPDGPKVRLWGPHSERRMFGDKHWREPLRWNAKAAAEGVRRRVFCASMADVFEDRPELAAPRARLYRLIEDTPALDWLLLTKRPENAAELWGQAWADAGSGFGQWPAPPAWRPNVWLGTTVEDQRRADERIPHLLSAPARVRFLSVEPMLGPIDLSAFFGGPYVRLPGDAIEPHYNAGIDWVICGGESGPGARPMRLEWARDLRDQCLAAGVPFFFKQWGEYVGVQLFEAHHFASGEAFNDPRGGTVAGARVGGVDSLTRIGVVYLGKKAAGRVLDGRTWDEFPAVAR